MTQDAAPASRLLLSAVQVLKDDANDSRIYTSTAGVWQEYLDVLVSTGRQLGASDVLLMLSDLAKAKSVLDPKNTAHYTEMVACIAGAAQLAEATPPAEEAALPKAGSSFTMKASSIDHDDDDALREFASKRLAPKPKDNLS